MYVPSCTMYMGIAISIYVCALKHLQRSVEEITTWFLEKQNYKMLGFRFTRYIYIIICIYWLYYICKLRWTAQTSLFRGGQFFSLGSQLWLSDLRMSPPYESCFLSSAVGHFIYWKTNSYKVHRQYMYKLFYKIYKDHEWSFRYVYHKTYWSWSVQL